MSSSIRSRLDRLEERASSGPGGCETCRGWSRVESFDWRSGAKQTSGSPARCPNCGREIPVIEIEEVEDWRGERVRRPV